MYGREIPGLEGFALHSREIFLPQPSTGEALHFTVPEPERFSLLLKGEL